MKAILVPVELHSSIDSVFQCARLLAERFKGHIDAIPLVPQLREFYAYSMPELPAEWMAAEQARVTDLVTEARERFEASMAGSNAAASATANRQLAHTFAATQTFGDREVATYARVFDVTVLGRPGKQLGEPRLACAETVLFESGRPVLLAPQEPPATLGETIIVAWNQSMESARATALAMPLLKRAKKVFILTIDAHNVDGPTADQLALMLSAQGITVDVVHRLGKKRAAGPAYLEDGASLGGDLMVKGSYTQSRLREMFFGGATAYILANARMPVMMSS